MTRYRITCDGYEVGVYEAADIAEALNQCARDHGYYDYLEAALKSARGDPVRRWEVEESDDP